MAKKEETIERLNKLKNRKILYGNRAGMIIEEFKTLQEDIETVLNMIKEKDKKIEKKEKQIDLIINEFYKRVKISKNCYIQKLRGIKNCLKYKNCKECLKQYFKELAERESEE